MGVGRRHPVMIRIESLRTVSILRARVLRHQTRVAYFAALYSRAKTLVCSLEALAPNVLQVRRLIRLFLAKALVRGFSQCYSEICGEKVMVYWSSVERYLK